MVSQAISHYRIISKLGAGGMGEVYLAEDTQLGRKVAIKLLPQKLVGDERARKRLLREAKAAAMLDHANICAIYEVGEEATASFIVMQYVEGETLHNRIQKSALALGEALDVGAQVADALAEAHAHRIIHRDIKPQNIIITPRGQVKVLDFGLAKAVQRGLALEPEAETESLITEVGAIIGTVGYMSPEQAKGELLDTRSDLFSLGAVLYECVTGRQAFSGSNPIDICVQVIHVNPQPPSTLDPRLPAELDRVIMKALAKAPAARYQSASEMIQDLTRVREALQPGDQARTQALPKHRTSRIRALATLSNILRRPNRVVVACVVALCVAALALWAWPRLHRPGPHQPSAEAKRWYDAGTNALRDGAYYQASKALGQAINVDDKFALAHARLAEAWTELDYSDKAKDELLRVASLVPDRSSLPPIEALYLQAINDTVTRELAGAVEKYHRLAEQAPEPEKAFAYVDLGRAYEKNEEINKAIESYQEAAKRDSQYAAAFLRLGILYGRQQDLKSAAGAFDKAESLYHALSNLEGVTETLYQRGTLLNNLDKVAEARPLLEKALGLAHNTANKYQQIRTLLQLSSVAWTEGDIERAKQYATAAINLAQADSMENLAINGLIQLGNAFISRGENAEAEKYFKQALELAQRYKGRHSEAMALLSLGSLYIQQEKTDEGITYVEQARAFYEQGGYHKEASLCLTLLGRANRQKGDYVAALRIFEEQLQVAKELGDPAQIASLQSSIGTLLGHYQELYSAALTHFDESYKINESLGAKSNLAYDLTNRGNMLWQLGHYEEARAALDRAASIADRPEAGSKQLSAAIHLCNARLALSEQRFPPAKAQSQQALDLAGTQYKEIIIQAKYMMGLAQALSGAPKSGAPLCEEAVTRATEMGNSRFLANALLALAEVRLEAGDAQKALATAGQAQTIFARFGRQDSEWRAWLIAARASQRAGDESSMRESASRASSLLANLQQRFGAEFYRSYLTRRDVQSYRKQLDQLLAVKR